MHAKCFATVQTYKRCIDGNSDGGSDSDGDDDSDSDGDRDGDKIPKASNDPRQGFPKRVMTLGGDSDGALEHHQLTMRLARFNNGGDPSGDYCGTSKPPGLQDVGTEGGNSKQSNSLVTSGGVGGFEF